MASHVLATTPGPHVPELRGTDNSPIIHPTMRAGVTSSGTWSVTVSSPLTPISGKKLLLKDGNDPTKRKVVFVSKDAQIDTGPSGIDPLADGATLQVYNANGSGESQCLTLPSGSWQSSASPSAPTCTYKDTSFGNGPCKVATVKHGTLMKIVCQARAQPLPYSRDEPTQAVTAVRFTSGATTYCASFGGTIKEGSGTDPPIAGGKGMFVAKDAAAPSPCPPVTAACP